MRVSRQRSGQRQGQALVEFALVFPMFLIVLMSILVLGLYVFYNQQLTNAAREAARYAAVHSSSAQCPTVSWIDPAPGNQFNSYGRCDAPEQGWPLMTAAARSHVFGMSPNQVSVTACWSGYVNGATNQADYPPTQPGAQFTDCRMNGVNPRTDPNGLACPAPNTIPSGSGTGGGLADGDDKASDLAHAPPPLATPAPGTTADPGLHVPTTVTVYTCFVWTPPMAGFVFIPNQVTLRAVITEALQRQQ